MAKLFCIITMAGGLPDVDLTATPVYGYVLCDQIGQYGAYLVSGTGAQLTALNATPQCVGIVAVTESGGVKWAELDGTIAPAIRTKLNTWITNNRPAWPQVPAGATYRQVIRALFARFNAQFDLDNFDVTDGS